MQRPGAGRVACTHLYSPDSPSPGLEKHEVVCLRLHRRILRAEAGYACQDNPADYEQSQSTILLGFHNFTKYIPVKYKQLYGFSRELSRLLGAQEGIWISLPMLFLSIIGAIIVAYYVPRDYSAPDRDGWATGEDGQERREQGMLAQR